MFINARLLIKNIVFFRLKFILNFITNIFKYSEDNLILHIFRAQQFKNNANQASGSKYIKK